MSKQWNVKRAKQARIRREKQTQMLETLKQQANAHGANKELKEYLAALKKRKAELNCTKKRVAKYRTTLKTDTEKAKKAKQVRRLYYTETKSQGKQKAWKATQRARKRFDMIKTKIEIEGNDINSRCMNFRKLKITPLGAAVRYCDLEAVGYLLGRKACPTRRYTSTLVTTPLYDAAWMGKSTIAELLLENSALPEGGLTNGALHGAIHNRMFRTVDILLNQGCEVNESYLQQTPLGAALTCGKSNSGDVRLVRRLLSAEADISKKTKMFHSPFFHAPMTQHVDLANKYSSKKCQAVLSKWLGKIL